MPARAARSPTSPRGRRGLRSRRRGARLSSTGRSPSSAKAIAFTPSHGRARVCRVRPSKTDRCVQVAEATELHRVFGGLEPQMTSCAPASTRSVRSKTPGSGFTAGRAPRVERRGTRRRGARSVSAAQRSELDHHSEPALHVARAEPDDRAVLDPAGGSRCPRAGTRVEVCPARGGRAVFPTAWRRSPRLAVVEAAGSNGTCAL